MATIGKHEWLIPDCELPPPGEGELKKMDLFCVSEIKRPKDGSMEIKFFDRMKALEKLSEGESGDGAASFYEAICRSAQALKEKEQEDKS